MRLTRKYRERWVERDTNVLIDYWYVRRRDERVDLRLVVDALAEGVRPEGPELAGRRSGPGQRAVRGEGREQTGHIPKDSRKRG